LEIRQTVGIVFQNPDNQFVATTVEEEVAFGPENLGLPPQTLRERVNEALEIAGLVESRQANPHDLSAGQKGRLAIASILAMRPECLILDEATAFLDPLAREGVLGLLARLHAQGMTLIMATHNMDEAALADRIVALEGGRIALEAKPREFFARQADLEQLGLGVPTVVAVVSALRARGVDLPPDLLTEREVAEALLGVKERLWAR
ncbi:MAG: ATP-binding cassette domain-containing protein, partial [Chloroflexi bacterium]|nr:ATP-binding cassette domain-containing protein [Chloroflexota bacterium]